MTIKDIHIAGQRIVIFGGPYSNLHALQAMKAKTDALSISHSDIICTGDIVGYCAYPEESIQFVKDWGIHCISGNVEFNLLDEADDCGCNFEEGSRCDIFSRQWFPFAKSKVSKNSLAYLATLPAFIRFTFFHKKYFVLHGSYQNTSEFIFKSTPWPVKESSFNSSKADTIIAGHCGLPFVDLKDDKTWINAGVIGMPANDGNPNTWFATLEKDSIRFEKLDYDHTAASYAVSSHPLPQSYARTLKDGLWDNCDILPPIETAAQGKVIF